MNFIKTIIVILMAINFSMANDDREPIKYNFLVKNEVQNFINMMVKQHKFQRSYMNNILKDARLDRDTLNRYTGKYKVGSTNGSWERYKNHVLDKSSLKKSKRFKKEYYKTLLKASREYKVDLDYIVGFIAVESKFGEYSGDYNVLDSLTTLAFHKNRMKKFFKSELKHLFLMSREQGYEIQNLEGSFAGAMGMVQQVPSIFRRYGMDYDNNGIKDPWSLEDSIGIIARFMHKNGWKRGDLVAIKASYKGKRFKKLRCTHRKTLLMSTIKKSGIKPLSKFNQKRAYLLKNRNLTHDDIWLGAKNFRVLTKYNNSTSYGMAIHLIAEHVK